MRKATPDSQSSRAEITLRLRLLSEPRLLWQKTSFRGAATTPAGTSLQSAAPSGPEASGCNLPAGTQNPPQHSGACGCNTPPPRRSRATRRQWTIALWRLEFRLNVGPLPEPSPERALARALRCSRIHARNLLAVHIGPAALHQAARLKTVSTGISSSSPYSTPATGGPQ